MQPIKWEGTYTDWVEEKKRFVSQVAEIQGLGRKKITIHYTGTLKPEDDQIRTDLEMAAKNLIEKKATEIAYEPTQTERTVKVIKSDPSQVSAVAQKALPALEASSSPSADQAAVAPSPLAQPSAPTDALTERVSARLQRQDNEKEECVELIQHILDITTEEDKLQEGVITWRSLEESVEYNRFSETYKNLPSKKGFKKDLYQIKAVAEKIIDQMIKDKKISEEERNGYIATLEERFTNYEAQFNDEKFPDIKEDTLSQYLKAYAQAEDLNAKFLADVLYLINFKQERKDYMTPEQFLDVLKSMVGLTKEPIILNRYSIGQNSMDQKISICHLQKPLSERLFKEGRKEGRIIATNFLVIANEAVKTYEVVNKVIRLPNYNPGERKDPIQAQAETIDNCKSVLTALAKKLYVEGTGDTEKTALVVPYRAMHLESSKDDIEETSMAMRSLHAQAIQVDIEGKKVWIRPEISYMNLGLGVSGSFQEGINARGLRGFVKECKTFKDILLQQLKHIPEAKELERLMGIVEVDDLSRTESEKNAQNEMDFANLLGQYQGFRRKIEEYSKPENARHKSANTIVLKAWKEQILTAEGHITRSAVLSKKARIDALKQKRIEIESTLSSINAVFSEMLDNKDISEADRKKIEQLRNFYECFNNFQYGYLQGIHHNNVTVAQVQAWYVLTCRAMGHEVFLVGDEGATGKIDDKVQELQFFRQKKGHYPWVLEDWVYLNQNIAPLVHKFSVNQRQVEPHRQRLPMDVSPKFNQELGEDRAEIYSLQSQFTERVFKAAKRKKSAEKGPAIGVIPKPEEVPVADAPEDVDA